MTTIGAPEHPTQVRVAEIEQWFLSYGAAFSKLASEMRGDNGALLSFYALPARIVGCDAEAVMRTSEALIGYGGIGAEVERLRQCGLVEAAIVKITIDLINLRGAVVHVTWRRAFLNGEANELSEVYIVVYGPTGWRITAVFERRC